jgi:hypothetical protein
MDANGFINAAIEFTALGIIAAQSKKGLGTKYHLFALGIELAFKALALRCGATPAECKKKCCHRVTDMIALCGKLGAKIPASLKRRLNDDHWFKKMLDTRYPTFNLSPTFKETLFVHSNYPEMIAEILSIHAPVKIRFEGGSALSEIKSKYSGLHF